MCKATNSRGGPCQCSRLFERWLRNLGTAQEITRARGVNVGRRQFACMALVVALAERTSRRLLYKV